MQSFNGSLLWEPWQILKQDQTAYKVFTPYYRRGCLPHSDPREPLSEPDNYKLRIKSKYSLTLKELNLLPKIKWYDGLSRCMTIHIL